MEVQPQSPVRLAFGPFELDSAAGELRRNGVRVRLSGQPLRILLVLLARPGELVSREQLREEVWTGETFVDFEHGLNAAVNKLRRALGDAAENPRYIETQPGRGYRFIGALEPRPTVPVPVLQSLPVEESPIREDLPEKRSVRVWWWLAAAAACMVSLAVGWLLRSPSSAPPPWKLTQLTSDSGLSSASAVSRDGKLLAYASDRGQDDGQDIYVKQITGGQPVRLTFDGQGNTSPDFSPDGSRIVFRSERDGGGIFEVPAFGGEARLLARDGLNPKFSPDGSQVAYWVGAPNVRPTIPGSGRVMVVPAAGGPPQKLGAIFTAARYPIWSPDGKHLLFIGYTSAQMDVSSGLDWWLAAVNGDQAVRTGTYEAFVHAGLRDRKFDGSAVSSKPYPLLPAPGCWHADASGVRFSDLGGDTNNIWEIGMSSQTGKVSGAPRRLTAGAGNESEPACASGDAFAFTNPETVGEVWSLPFDLDGGRPLGALEPVTQGPATRENPSLSADGRYVAFASTQSGQKNIWLRELATGRESQVARSPFVQRYPVINASGSRIAFSVWENGKRLLYASTPGGVPEMLCQGCSRAQDWSHDGKSLLAFGGSPFQFFVLDLASHRQTTLLRHPKYNLLYGRFSPDYHWMTFTARLQPGHARIMIAPADGPKPVPESAWIQIAEERDEDWANWAPDGKTLYFTSARDGHTCLWAQRLDAVSHRPVGDAFAVQHFHGRASYQQNGWSAAAGRIVVALNERTGNIWMMSRSGAH
jgi:Tol biopolymer transport system component/DNA-binding winged helix-turn-helix (wHTH) protein